MEIKSSPQVTRVYALDALRGIMMLLGLVIHAGLTYGREDYQAVWPLKDSSNSIVLDILVAYIHTFRMPVFFVVAGYFAALLFYKKGPKAMLVNRFKRILLPFLAGVLIIYPLVDMSLTFSAAAFGSSKSPFKDAWNVLITGNFLPFNVAHLWFLYFLVLYVATGLLLAMVLKSTSTFITLAENLFIRITENVWLRIFCLTTLLFGCLYWMGTPFILTNNDWKIDPSTFITYLILFETGWMIYRTNMLLKLTGHPILQLALATLFFSFLIFIPWPKAAWVMPVQILITAIYTSLFIFGFIALFLKYFNHYSKSMSYLMDASYWVYIIHLPVVSFIPGLMAGFLLPAYIKFGITLISTAIICLASYQFLVRNTFVGMFLNGKVYKRNKIHCGEDNPVAVK